MSHRLLLCSDTVGVVWQQQNSSCMKLLPAQLCDLCRVTGSWFLESDTATEIFKWIFSAPWAPQAECHPVPLFWREGQSSLHVTPKQSRRKNNPTGMSEIYFLIFGVNRPFKRHEEHAVQSNLRTFLGEYSYVATQSDPRLGFFSNVII